ncbi:autotransporter domain-containing protein [Phaeobacter sp. HF9A]|uniref:autotransporter domain-containing protein n=1 Tax=Phaeobacter sp. HF9A TaxID=2721561 RepID=UPI00143147B6|nr:autotransporter domain-containing protein [Phaeobacter sp. HF9A]NIZ12335.1 autotransporter outer membrane beta-barrel domain-containing protein [Phaeobacter sp. HF9A]
MKLSTPLMLAALTCGLTAGQVMAQDGPPPGAPQLPPGVLAQINLGQAGLLASFYRNEQWGTTQGRIGLSRSTIAAATAPFGPTTGFKDGSTDTVAILSALKGLPDGKSYLRFSGNLAMPNGQPNLVEQDATNPSGMVQYMTFPNPDTMLSIGAFAERFDVETVGSSTVLRDGYGIRADVLHKFSPSWGIAARAEYSWGESDLKLPAIGYQHVQGDDRFYTQMELVGTYDSSQIAAVPEGWLLQPVLGANFQHNSIEATVDSFGATSAGVNGDSEEYGMLWASLGLQQKAAPGQWAWNASLGLEHEYTNSLNAFVDEPTYVVGSIGATMMTKSGHQFVLSYTRHQGLNGNRWNQTLLAGFYASF